MNYITLKTLKNELKHINILTQQWLVPAVIPITYDPQHGDPVHHDERACYNC